MCRLYMYTEKREAAPFPQLRQGFLAPEQRWHLSCNA